MTLAQGRVCLQLLARRTRDAALLIGCHVDELSVIALSAHALGEGQRPGPTRALAALAVQRRVGTRWAQLALGAVLVEVPPLCADAGRAVNL